MQEVGVPIVLYALEEHAVVIKFKTRVKVVFILVLAPDFSVTSGLDFGHVQF